MMTSSIGAHIYTHYTMPMQMLLMLTKMIGAQIYTQDNMLTPIYTDGIEDDECERSAYIFTTP
jgi:hypothetical protein